MSRYIYNIIKEGEHQRLDFKFEISDARKIARTMVAFANTNGGKLLIGVKDNGKIAGVRSEEEVHMLEAAGGMYCKPNINPKIKNWIIEGKTVIEADVQEGKKKPYYALEENGRWMAWFRQADENHLANPIMLEVWKNQNESNGILLHFTQKEEFLLSYLNSFKKISQEDFCKISGIGKRKSTSIISKLIIFELIDFEYIDGEFYYFSKE